MKGTHELGPKTSRRGALGLIGGFFALAVGSAPKFHQDATLDATISVLSYEYADPSPERLDEDETAPDIAAVNLEVVNHGEAFTPLFFTWDQKRKTRHNWRIETGPETLPADDTVVYRIGSVGEDSRINAGHPAQLTLFEKGKQHWETIQFTPDPQEESR